MRNAVRKLRAITDKEEALKLYPSVQKMLDKLAKTNIIHKNKASNLKSKLACHIRATQSTRQETEVCGAWLLRKAIILTAMVTERLIPSITSGASGSV